MPFKIAYFIRARFSTLLNRTSPELRDIQLGKSILAAQEDVLNFFNESYHHSACASNYNENVLLSIDPLNLRVYGPSSYRTFFSFLTLSIAKLWCGIDQDALVSVRNHSRSQSKIEVQIVNFSDRAMIKENNMFAIQWKVKMVRYPPTFMSLMIMFPLTKKLYFWIKFLSAHNDHSFRNVKKDLEGGIYPERYFSKNSPQEHIVNGYSYFTFDQEGKILSHNIDNIVPPPKYAFTSIVLFLFRYPFLSSRLSYLWPKSPMS